MNILIVHNSFPGQYKNLIIDLVLQKHNIVFFTLNKIKRQIKGVTAIQVPYKEEIKKEKLVAFSSLKENLSKGIATLNSIRGFLLKTNYKPDIVLGHSGFGVTAYLRDLFPTTPILINLEWYQTVDPLDDFDIKDEAVDIGSYASRNLDGLLDIASADCCIVPTVFQYNTYPKRISSNIKICHEGIDTNFYRPAATNKIFSINDVEYNKDYQEIITYSTRGMEPLRGFPQFIQAVQQVLLDRPKAIAIVAGLDKVFYSTSCFNQSFKNKLLAQFPINSDRIHFVGGLNSNEYLKLLQNTDVHVYFTCPFPLSWSMLEAMSCGACVISSKTEPVEEVIIDDVNGYLVDFHRPDLLSKKINYVLDNKNELDYIKRNARLTVLSKYDIRTCNTFRLKLMNRLIKEKKAKTSRKNRKL